MASIHSSSESGSDDAFLSISPNLNETSRLLPDLEKEILGIMGEREDRAESQSTINEPPTDREDNRKSVFESWVITYHAQEEKLAGWYQWLGICWWRRIETEGARILAVVPNCHFSQEEMEGVYDAARKEYHAAPTVHRKALELVDSEAEYTADLERRLRRLDWVVQDEIYDLIHDRIQSSSDAFRRRDWKLVMLNEVPGGEITDVALPEVAGGRHRFGKVFVGRLKTFTRVKWRRKRDPKMPITEYRLILRGTETKVNEKGWPSYNRYSRTWRDVDDQEVGEVKINLRRRGSQFVSDKSLNF